MLQYSDLLEMFQNRFYIESDAELILDPLTA